MKKTKRKHPPSFLGGPAAQAALRSGNRHVGRARLATDTYRAAWESAAAELRRVGLHRDRFLRRRVEERQAARV